MKERVKRLSDEEFKEYPVENGVVKVIVLDGVKNIGHYVQCPEHGDTLIHTHNTKGSKVKFVDEYLI